MLDFIVENSTVLMLLVVGLVIALLRKITKKTKNTVDDKFLQALENNRESVEKAAGELAKKIAEHLKGKSTKTPDFVGDSQEEALKIMKDRDEKSKEE